MKYKNGIYERREIVSRELRGRGFVFVWYYWHI